MDCSAGAPAHWLLNVLVMKTGSLVLWAGLTVGLATFSAGCIPGGCDAAGNGYRAPVTFTPSSTEAFRTPATCGVMNPAFTPQDTFSLELTGDTSGPAPYTTITVAFVATAQQQQAVPLVVSQSSPATYIAESQDGTIRFSFQVGANTDEIDSTPVDAVIVTLNAMPTANGQPLAAEIQIEFEDGAQLDQTYSAAVQTELSPCQ